MPQIGRDMTLDRNMETPREIALIGPGRVGTALGRLAVRAGWRVVAIGGRNAARTREAAERIGSDVAACDMAPAACSARFVLLTLSDDAISSVCQDLAEQSAFKPGAIVAHCSGALASAALEPAVRLCQCAVASMHPLQTFPNFEDPGEMLRGVACVCEGDERALQSVEMLARDLGMQPIRIASEAKTLYHAAAVMACNYLTALMDAALETAERAGIEREVMWKALRPLVDTTLRNITAMGAPGALSGPIARGDASTVRHHVEALDAESPSLSDVYKTLGERAVALALEKGTLTAERAREIQSALFGKDKGS